MKGHLLPLCSVSALVVSALSPYLWLSQDAVAPEQQNMIVCMEKQEDLVSPEMLYNKRGPEKLLLSLMVVVTLAVKSKS